MTDQTARSPIGQGPSYGFLPPVALAPGDRFPNFVLPDQSGQARTFLERAKGSALLIIVDGDDVGLRSLRPADAKAIGIDLLAIVGEAPVAAAARAAKLDIDFPLLSDPPGEIRAKLRQMMGIAPHNAFAVLLDPNQRIVAVTSGLAGPELVQSMLDRARALPRPEAGQYLKGVAPVLLVPDVLRPEDCRALIDRWQADHEEGYVSAVEKGSEVRRVDKAMKSRLDHRIMDDALLTELAGVIGRRIAPELNKAFGFGRFNFDRFVVTCYDSARDDFFRRHRDNETPGTTNRRFALTLNLNTGEYEGGGLTFPEYGPHRYDPPAGGAILFSCSLLHEALPITRGRRFTLLNFLRS